MPIFSIIFILNNFYNHFQVLGKVPFYSGLHLTNLKKEKIPRWGHNFKAKISKLTKLITNFRSIHLYFYQIWDTAGQEKFKALAKLYYRGKLPILKFQDASVAIIVYDITNRNSFDVVKDWVAELREKGPSNIGKFIFYKFKKKKS